MNFSARITSHMHHHGLGLLALEMDPSDYKRLKQQREGSEQVECNQSLAGAGAAAGWVAVGSGRR